SHEASKLASTNIPARDRITEGLRACSFKRLPFFMTRTGTERQANAHAQSAPQSEVRGVGPQFLAASPRSTTHRRYDADSHPRQTRRCALLGLVHFASQVVCLRRITHVTLYPAMISPNRRTFAHQL